MKKKKKAGCDSKAASLEMIEIQGRRRFLSGLSVGPLVALLWAYRCNLGDELAAFFTPCFSHIP